MKKQEVKFKSHKLDKTMKLEKKKSPLIWDGMYELAKSYYKQHGHLLIPLRFKTTNGYEYDEEGYPLGRWLQTQRISYKNRSIPKEQRKNSYSPLTDERMNKLLKIGMVFDSLKEVTYELNWNQMYKLAELYYNYHKNLFIPQDFKTKNGYFYDLDGYALGTWISIQRIAYKNRSIPKEQINNTYFPLTDERLEKLLEIGMIFENVEQARDEYIWNQVYELAKSYYKQHGHLLIPFRFKTTNGYEYDEDGYPLGRWLKTQRISYRNRSIPKEQRKNSYSLTDERMNKLLKIGMVFDNLKEVTYELNWNQMYKLAELYYNYYKNLFIPQDFKTKNGYFYDLDGYALGAWINTQRIAYKNRFIPEEKRTNSQLPLTDKKMNKLLEIGMIFENVEQARDEYIWSQVYELAKSYYKHHGHLLIPESFKTTNGYEYDEYGYSLGYWIRIQRVAYKNREIPKEQRKNSYSPLTDERLEKLLVIDMVFSPKENKQDCIKLCEEYGLDTKKYKYLKDNISYRELNAKINYLIDNKKPIIIDGKPNYLFFMTNNEMQENKEYQISKKELIKQYYRESMSRGR